MGYYQEVPNNVVMLRDVNLQVLVIDIAWFCLIAVKSEGVIAQD